MVKIRKADLDPKAFTHTLKGFYLKTWMGRTVVAKSPKGGKRDHPASVWNRQQFAIAARMAASPLWLDQMCAMNWSNGTEQVPRDILVMAAYGNYVSLILPDGRETTVADHSYYGQTPEPGEEYMLIASAYDDAFTASSTSTTLTYLGGLIRFDKPCKVREVGIVAAQSVPWAANIHLCRLDETLTVVQVLASGPTGEMPTSRKAAWIDADFDFAAGDEVAIVVQQTSDPMGRSFFLPMLDLPHWLWPITSIRTLRANGPWIGVGSKFTSITTGATIACMLKIAG